MKTQFSTKKMKADRVGKLVRELCLLAERESFACLHRYNLSAYRTNRYKIAYAYLMDTEILY